MTDFRKGSTTIGLARLCPRKWRFSLDHPIPPSPWQELGTRVHKQFELYFLGTPFDLTTEEGNIALAGAHLYPNPSPHLWVERPWEKRLGRHTITGTFDLVDPTGPTPEIPNCPWYARNVPVLYDHKTTASFDWALTPETLETNLQTLLYCWALDAPEVHARWVYLRKVKPYRAKAVDARITRAMVDAALPGIEATLDRMAELAERPPHDAPFNHTACRSFGGCPFVSQCGLTLGDIMSASDDFKAQMMGGAVNPPPATGTYSPSARHTDDRKHWLDTVSNTWQPVPAAPAAPPPPPPPPPAPVAAPPPPPELPPPPPPPAPEAPAKRAGRPPKDAALTILADVLEGAAKALRALA